MIEAILSFILFTVVGFWILGIVGRFFLRRWILKKQREFEQHGGGNGGFYTNFNFGGQSARQRYERASQTTQEGEVRVKNVPSAQTKKVSKDVGEYVDYEDIK